MSRQTAVSGNPPLTPVTAVLDEFAREPNLAQPGTAEGRLGVGWNLRLFLRGRTCQLRIFRFGALENR